MIETYSKELWKQYDYNLTTSHNSSDLSGKVISFSAPIVDYSRGNLHAFNTLSTWTLLGASRRSVYFEQYDTWSSRSLATVIFGLPIIFLVVQTLYRSLIDSLS